MTIRSIRLINFRQFADFRVTARDTNILVGPNNSGKSTILDTLRLVNDVFRFSMQSRPLPESHDAEPPYATLTLGHSSISPPIENICRDYSDEDAIACVTHRNSNELVIRLHPERPIKAYLRTKESMPLTSAALRRMFPVNLVVVPTLGPLEKEELHLAEKTVARNDNTRLASRSFRNILLRKSNEEFSALAKLVADTWPSVAINFPETYRSDAPKVQMFYSERRIQRELFWSGFGFQIWLQLMNQLLRGRSGAIIVIDEPDHCCPVKKRTIPIGWLFAK